MPKRHLAALLIALIWVASLGTPIARAQYTAGLPAGITSVEIDGQPIDSATTPTTDKTTPQISGRVDLGVAAIDLAIANGEVIRFQATVDDRGRFRADAPRRLPEGQYTLYINDLLIGAFVVAGTTEEERQPGRLLDIARVVPYPADFAGSIPGIGFLDGRFYSLHEEAVRTSQAGGSDQAANVRETERQLAEAGWLQRYENRLAAPSPDGPETFSVQFSSFIVEYASGADAKTAFAGLVGDNPGIDFATIGDESQLTLISGVTPDTGASYQAARLVYRVGPMLGMIVYADLLNQQPDLSLLATIAQTVAARGTVVADRQTVPLGSMALRLDASDATGRVVIRNIYDVRGGQLTTLYNQTDETQAARVSLFTGTTDAFASTVSGTFSQERRGREETQAAATPPSVAAPPTPTSVIGIEGESAATPSEAAATPDASLASPPQGSAETVQVLMTSALYAFPDDAGAEAWFTTQRDRLAANPQSGAATYGEEPDAPGFGDSSATFVTTRPVGGSESPTEGYRIYVRVGAIVAVLEVASLPGISLRGAGNLVEMQLTCIEAQGCTGPAPLPANLFATRDGQSSRETDLTVAAATPSASMQPSESVIAVEGEATEPETAAKPTRAPRQKDEKPDRESKRDKKSAEEPPAS